jgi:hypothetical protein
MALRKKRSPYAPRRQPATIDLAAEQAAVDRNRAEVVRVDELARTSMVQDRQRADPLNQLVERAHRTDQAIDALRTELHQELDGLRALVHQSLGGS